MSRHNRWEYFSGTNSVGLPATLKMSGRDKDFTIAPDDAKYLQELSWKVYQRELKHTKPAKLAK